MKAILSLLFTVLLYHSAESQVVPDATHEGAYFYPRPVYLPQAMHFKPTNDITRDTTTDHLAERIHFNFITDYPHSGLPGNFYIKPGNLIATVMTYSKPLHYKEQNTAPQRDILHEKNILFKDSSKLSKGQK